MRSARFLLVLDPGKAEAELWAECSLCGAIAIRTLESVWASAEIPCECGTLMQLLPDDFNALEHQASSTSSRLRALLLPH